MGAVKAEVSQQRALVVAGTAGLLAGLGKELGDYLQVLLNLHDSFNPCCRAKISEVARKDQKKQRCSGGLDSSLYEILVPTSLAQRLCCQALLLVQSCSRGVLKPWPEHD